MVRVNSADGGNAPGSAPERSAKPASGGAPILGPAALLWLEKDSCARLILGETLDILWLNAAARDELAKKRDVELRGNQLCMVDRGQQGGLETFIAGCGGEIGSWSVPRSDGDGHLLFRANRLEVEGFAGCGISFYGSGSEFRERYANLDAIFGLTPTEHQVLLKLLDGRDATQIAASDVVSIETTRSHIRSIYLKLDVNSREGLFHKLRPHRL